MKSAPTIIEEAQFDKLNQSQFEEFIRKANPELYLIHIALEETGVNPIIIPHVIRAAGNLAIGSGFGEVQIVVRAGNVAQVKGTESVILNEKITIDTEE